MPKRHSNQCDKYKADTNPCPDVNVGTLRSHFCIGLIVGEVFEIV